MSRSSSVTRNLGARLTASGARYAVLVDGESDLDLVVAPGDRRVLESVVRQLGPLLQVQHYDIPHCRLYAVRVDVPRSRYRRVDVVCDPWGINRYGIAPSLALESAVVAEDGIRRPSVAGKLVYLVAKSARKGLGEGRHAELIELGRLAGDEGAVLLRRAFGRAGEMAAQALHRESPAELDAALVAVSRALDSYRRRPAALGLLVFFGARRALVRALKPTGFALCLSGPDGVGKSTVTRHLLELRPSPFHSTVRLGQRRGFFRKPGQLLRRTPGDVAQPHERQPSGRIGSLARLVYLWADALAGWPLKVATARRRATLVLLERGFTDFAVDPRRYRLSTPAAIARWLAYLLPQPDATVILRAPGEKVHERKTELSPLEIDRQLARWEDEARFSRGDMFLVDAAGSETETLENVLDGVEAVLGQRARDVGTGRMAIDLLGAPSARGTRHRLTYRNGTARYVIPVRVGSRGPEGRGLYRPATAIHVIGSAAIGLAHRLAVGPSIRIDQSAGAAPSIAQALGLPRVELAAVAARDAERGERALLGVYAGGRLVAYGKAARGNSTLARELEVLEAVCAARPRAVSAPRPLGLLEWNGFEILLLEPVSLAGRAHRPLGGRELDALEDLAAISIGPRRPGEITVHGDFTAWNTGAASGNRLAVVDWERASAGLPLEDLFHWRVQELIHFGGGTPESLVHSALHPDTQVRELASRLGVDASIAPQALLRAVSRPDVHATPSEHRTQVSARISHLLEVAA